jgi:gliding motility-associated-like protein
VTNGDEVDPDGDGTAGPNGTYPDEPCSLTLEDQTLSPSAEWLALDCDNDSLTNENEVIIGTDPFNPDSDGDGVIDGDEVDPDGDGTPGPNGTNPTDPCDLTVADQTVAPSAAWLAADCDDDGVSNGDEVAGGSDPLNPCSPILCEIIIPEAFSPDGDGINDNFVIEGIELIPDNEITIFNRWGNVVFQTSNYQNNWDGTSSNAMNIGGGDLPTGTYYYILDPKKEGYEVYNGFIYLQR